MLKELHLQNFKKYPDTGDIEIKPLTILCGANSSGKSTVLKSLLLLKQSFEDTKLSHALTLNGSYVDCGNMGDVITHNQKSNVTTLSNTFIFYPPTHTHTKPDVTIYRDLCRIYCTTENKNPIKMKVSLDVISVDLDTTKNDIRNYFIELRQLDEDPLTITIKHTPKRQSKNRYSLTIENFRDSKGMFHKHLVLDDCICYFEGIRIVNMFKANEPTDKMNYSDIFDIVYTVFRQISQAYRTITHISPLREKPSRNYIAKDYCYSVGSAGQFAPHVIHNNNNPTFKVDSVLPPMNEKLSLRLEKYPFTEALNSWTKYLGLGRLDLKVVGDILRLYLNDDSIDNVGFGASQVLPIIVECLTARKSQTLLIEQPEIHLHPKMQLNIADFFICSSQGLRNVIIETHSDHIINRVVRRIIEDTTGTLNKQISILYFDEDKDGNSTITPIIVDDRTGIVNWPDGFFDQYPDEQTAILRAGLIKRKHLRENGE